MVVQVYVSNIICQLFKIYWVVPKRVYLRLQKHLYFSFVFTRAGDTSTPTNHSSTPIAVQRCSHLHHKSWNTNIYFTFSYKVWLYVKLRNLRNSQSPTTFEITSLCRHALTSISNCLSANCNFENNWWTGMISLFWASNCVQRFPLFCSNVCVQ